MQKVRSSMVRYICKSLQSRLKKFGWLSFWRRCRGKPYEQITLCRHCAEDYRAAGYILVIDKTVDVMDWCELCGRRAWTYLIVRGGDKK